MSLASPPSDAAIARGCLRRIEYTYGDGTNAADNERLHAIARAVRGQGHRGITEIIPSYRVLSLEYDASRISRNAVEAAVALASSSASSNAEIAETIVRVAYDGEDLAEVARQLNLSESDVVAIHAGRTYRVYAMGFTPGFPFMGFLDDRLHLPRRSVPRARVEPNSVAIAKGQTGVYPLPSPGGWHILGTALETLYDPTRDRPFLLEPGANVRFVPSSGTRPTAPEPLSIQDVSVGRPALCIEKSGMLDLIVDPGRFGVGHLGLVRGGPVDLAAFRAANHLVGNAGATAALEINGIGPTIRALRSIVLGVAGRGIQARHKGTQRASPCTLELARGETVSILATPQGTRGYLALQGGIAVQPHHGSASTDIRGLIGAPLKAGTTLHAAKSVTVRIRAVHGERRPWIDRSGAIVIRVRPGPQYSKAAASTLTRNTYTVASADRMGLRLDGPDVPGGDVLSEPTHLGAIQVTGGGMPLLLLHDRGTLGGYAKPLITDSRDLATVAQLRRGDRLLFRLSTRTPFPRLDLEEAVSRHRSGHKLP